jgi:hypothetical protein
VIAAFQWYMTSVHSDRRTHALLLAIEWSRHILSGDVATYKRRVFIEVSYFCPLARECENERKEWVTMTGHDWRHHHITSSLTVLYCTVLYCARDAYSLHTDTVHCDLSLYKMYIKLIEKMCQDFRRKLNCPFLADQDKECSNLSHKMINRCNL